MARRTWHLPLILSGALLAAVTACGGSDPSTATAGSTPAPAASGTAQASAAPSTTPSGAPAPSGSGKPTTPGAPAVCGDLAKSDVSAALQAGLRDLAAPDTTKAGQKRLRDTAAQLTGWAAKADGELKTSLATVSGALANLAAKGLADTAAVEKAGNALLTLDDAVLMNCGFPLSE